METFIRNTLMGYTQLVSERNIYNMWMKTSSTPEYTEKIKLLDLKITIINSWLNLLTEDERFVIENHFVNRLEWNRIIYRFKGKWDFELSERTMRKYQNTALKKISDFIEKNIDVIESAFGNLN